MHEPTTSKLSDVRCAIDRRARTSRLPRAVLNCLFSLRLTGWRLSERHDRHCANYVALANSPGPIWTPFFTCGPQDGGFSGCHCRG